LDGLPWIGRRAIEAFAGVAPLAPIAANENQLADVMRSQTIGTNHVCGTARMGRDDDPMAVVDHRGVVKGVEGLTIGDASVMPTVPSGNTHLPVVMAAERIAASLKERRRRHG
jgi:5-(hydroxymethyl)furfural/furfural oxidase